MSYGYSNETISRICDLSKSEVFEFRRLVEKMRVNLDRESREIDKGFTFSYGPKRLSEEYRELSLIVPVLEKMIKALE